MREVKRVAPGCDDPLIELRGRRRPTRPGEQHATRPLFCIESAGHREQLWPGTRRLEVVLYELLSVVVGDLYVWSERQEIPGTSHDPDGHKGGVDGRLHLLLLKE